MAATTDQQGARMFSLLIGVGELVRDGNRDAEQVLEVLQIIKSHQDFAVRLLASKIDTEAPKSPFLEVLGTVSIPAMTERFVTKQKFVVDTSRKARVKVSYLGHNFQTWFLEKVEEPAAEVTLRYARLSRGARDNEIRAELGTGFEETTLAQIYYLMEHQPNGEDGVLLTDWWNVFYPRDIRGVLHAVSVDWGGDGWRVRAYSVDHLDGWGDGGRVFSRNS